jgi:hypothetical protein
MTASVDNYFIGKGIVSFKKTGGSYVDMGNCPTFEFTPDLTTLDHFSSRSGTKAKDKTIIIEKKGTLKVVLDEWTLPNLAIAMLDDAYSGTGAIDIFAGAAVTGSIKCVGTNDIGTQFTIELLNVSFKPSGSLGFITDEWGQIELEADVAVDGTSGSFGSIIVNA